MFDSIANNINPRTLGSAWNGYTSSFGQAGQHPFVYGDGEGGPTQTANPYDLGEFTPEMLAAIGYTGDPGSVYTYDNSFSGADSGPGPAGSGPANGWSDAFKQFLAAKGITPYDGAGESGYASGFFGPDGKQIGPTKTWGEGSDDAFGIAALLGGGFAGAAAMGVGAGAAGAAGGATSGASSADLAALYGDAGYGATGAGEAGGLAGTGLPEFSAYTGAGSAPGLAAGPGGLSADAVGGGAVGGGATAGASSSDLAALYGADGYGAAASPAELAAGGSGGGGIMSSLGNYANDASTWMKANPGLTNVGGGLLNSAIGAYTSGRALNAQTNATNNANALLQSQYQQNRADFAPYRATGVQALSNINGLLANPNNITSDPGYQFGLNQGQASIDRSAASKGGLYSGATLKALQRYGQDYAGTKLDQTLGRYTNVAQLGATGVAGTANSGNIYATNAANNTTGLGNAAAGSAMYTGNTAMNGVNNALGNFNFSNNGGSANQLWNQSTYGGNPKGP